MDEFDDPDAAEDELPDLHVITIMYSQDDDEPPVVDLGLTSPWMAVTLLEQIANYISMTLIPPTVSYNGNVIFSALVIEDDEGV